MKLKQCLKEIGKTDLKGLTEQVDEFAKGVNTLFAIRSRTNDRAILNIANKANDLLNELTTHLDKNYKGWDE